MIAIDTTIWAVLLAAGVPAALTGVLIGRLNRRIETRDAEKDAKDEARMENIEMMIKLNMAALSLGEATAEAVQRIPDANCNGDMHEALAFAKQTKNEYREFERRQTARSLG